MIGPARTSWAERVIRREKAQANWHGSAGEDDGSTFLICALAVSLGAIVYVSQELGFGR